MTPEEFHSGLAPKIGDTITIVKAARFVQETSPAWLKFMDFCKAIGHGEIEKVKIMDGCPVLAEKVTQKTKFA